MSKIYICDGTKYEIGGPKADTIGLPVSITSIPLRINIEGYELQLKSSFHVSLVCIGKMIEKYKISIPDFVNKVIEDFCSFVSTTEINFLKYRNEFRKLRTFFSETSGEGIGRMQNGYCIFS